MGIEIIKNDTQPDLPWTFKLPFKGQKKIDNEPTYHRNGIQTLSKAEFEYQNSMDDKYFDMLREEKQIELIQSSRNWLKLIFDESRQGKMKSFNKLKLTIEY